MIKHHCYYLFHHIITVATTWVQHLSTWHKLGKWNQLKGAMMRWCMSIMMLRHRAKLKLPCNLNSGSVWPMQEFCMPYISLSCDCDLFIQSGILVSCLLDISFNVKIYRGWGCIVNCFMLSSLPCFYALCWSAIPTSCYIFNIFNSCSCHFFKQQMHASLSSQASLVDVSVLAEESLTRPGSLQTLPVHQLYFLSNPA